MAGARVCAGGEEGEGAHRWDEAGRVEKSSPWLSELHTRLHSAGRGVAGDGQGRPDQLLRASVLVHSWPGPLRPSPTHGTSVDLKKPDENIH